MKKIALILIGLLVLALGAAAADTITLPSEVTAIEAEAFRGDTAATEFLLPSTITEIGEGAFRDCGDPDGTLKYYFAPSGVTVGADAFTNCRATIRINGNELPKMTYTVGEEGVTITGGTVLVNATGSSGYGITGDETNYKLTIGADVTSVVISAGECATDFPIVNAIAGTGWTDAAGTEGEADIAVSTAGVTNKTYKRIKFQAKTYTVTFDLNGQEGSAPEAQTVTDGGKAAKPATDPAAAGYTFDGWYKEADCTTAWDFDTDVVTADTTLYAKWLKNIAAAAEDVTAAYDGEAHGINISITDPESGATVSYGTAEGTYDRDSSPAITDVADSPLTVYYKVSADGYNDLTGSASVTISKAAPAVSAPTAKTLTYTGSDQELVSAGSTEGGTMYYCLGTDATTAPTDSAYTTSIPAATDAGT